MASNLISQLTSDPSSLSFHKSTSDRLEYVSEIIVEPDKINPTELPIINSYATFVKPFAVL